MIYFVSDIHLGAGGEELARETERRFVRWLDMVGEQAEVIILAGDVFDFWFEYQKVVPKGFVRVLGRLAALTDRGVRVVMLTGNHDMWVHDYFTRECGVEIYAKPQLMTLAGKRIFVAHGDNMNINSQPILRLLNAIFRSRRLRWVFSWFLHPDLAIRFGQWWSGNSRKRHNGGQTLDSSHVESLIKFAREYACLHEVDYFIFGHMHFAHDYNHSDLRVINLGSWDQNPSYAVLDDRGNISLKMLDL